MENQRRSPAATWTGRILKILCTLFLIFDAGMKIIKNSESIKSSGQLGFPVDWVQPIGILLLLITILYVIPKTAVFESFLLLLAYLGGAAAIMLRAQMEGHPYFFPIAFGVVALLAEYLNNARLKERDSLYKIAWGCEIKE